MKGPEKATADILVVDDEDHVRQSFSDFLEDSGFTVRSAEDGRQGLDRIAEYPPDLVILDLRMPELDGFQVLEQAQKIAPDTAYIVISGLNQISDAVRALKAGAWDYLEKPVQDFSILHHAVTTALDKKRLIQENRQFQEHLEKAKRLRLENHLLKSKLMHPYGLAHLVGTSERMQVVYDQIIKSVGIDENIVVYGESGTGKELVAKSIHDLSARKDKPFIAVNCGAIPETLFESEFFGHKKGAFTGAGMDKIGFFESADRGTLFLDEIGEIPLNLQVKLLRTIEGGGFTPVGGTRERFSNVRVIAATNRDLKAMVEAGKVREDFYYRIHIIPIQIPALRDRKEDIPLLVYHFAQKISRDGKKAVVPDAVIRQFLKHNWPGNVRELQNTISRYLAFEKVDFAGPADRDTADSARTGPDDPIPDSGDLNTLLKAYESKLIQNALSKTEGNKSQAARQLGIDRRSLLRKIERLGL